VLVLLATACGGGTSPAPGTPAASTAASAASSPTGGGGSGTAIDVCAKLTMSAVLAAVGGTDPKGTVTNTADHRDCAYTFSTPSSSGPIGWQVDVEVWDPSDWDYQKGLPADQRQDLTGLGDAAFIEKGVGTRDLWLKRGDLVVSVSAPDHDGAADLVEKVAALALQTF
jgi:hypothetical protein